MTQAARVARVERFASQPPLLLTVDEAAFKLGLHRSRLYPLMNSGEIRSIKIGKSRRILLTELESYIARLLDEQGLSAR